MQTQDEITVPGVRIFKKCLDMSVLPMKHVINLTDIIISGSHYGPPRRTTPWNWVQVPYEHVSHFNKTDMTFFKGDPKTATRYVMGIPLMFLRSCTGSWNAVKVLEPTDAEKWHIGWISGSFVGLSCLQLKKSVCMLLGPGDVYFFGIRASDGTQMPIVQVAQFDRRAPEPEYANVPLL